MNMKWHLDWGLSEKEICYVGKIVVEWAAMEHEIFAQVLSSHKSTSENELPKALNGLQFTTIFNLWEKLVENEADEGRLDVLKAQIAEIKFLKDFRDALAHGMWTWDPSTLERITSFRPKHKTLLMVHFTPRDLEDIATRLADVNFRIRHPSRPEDFLKSMIDSGGIFFPRSILYDATTAIKKAADGENEPLDDKRPVP